MRDPEPPWEWSETALWWKHPSGVNVFQEYAPWHWMLNVDREGTHPMLIRVRMSAGDACALCLACQEPPIEKQAFMLQPLMFGKWGLNEFDGTGFAPNMYHYDTVEDALASYRTATHGGPEPEGWFRHVQSGRRRPGGDASKEYVQA